MVCYEDFNGGNQNHKPATHTRSIVSNNHSSIRGKLVLALLPFLLALLLAATVEGQQRRSESRAPIRVSHEAYGELELNNRHQPTADSSTLWIEGVFKAMIPLPDDYSNLDWGVNFLARLDADRGDVAMGGTLLFPGFEFGGGSGITLVFNDVREYDRGRPTNGFCVSGATREQYRYNTDRCSVKAEYMQRLYVRSFNEKVYFDAELQHSTAYRNSLSLQPLYYEDLFADLYYSAKLLMAATGHREAGLQIGLIVERHLGFGFAGELRSKHFDLIGAVARDPEENRMRDRLKISIGGRWNLWK